MVSTLTKISNWKFILPLFVLFALFSFLIFPQYQSRMAQAARQEITPLDTRFNYSEEEVRRDFEKLHTGGREIYSIVVGRVDMLFPISYGLLFILLLAYLLRKTVGDSRWILLAFLPVVGVMFDYLENISILRLLNDHPDFSAADVNQAERITQLKHWFLFLSVGLMLLLTITLLIRKIAYRKGTSISGVKQS